MRSRLDIVSVYFKDAWTVFVVFQTYGMPLINVFLISSTYLMVIVAIVRYFAVASPFRGRSNSFIRRSGVASAAALCAVVFVTLPQFVHYRIDIIQFYDRNLFDVAIDNDTIIYGLVARFAEHHMEAIAYYNNRIQPILSSFLPCLLLIIFNIGLIFRLRRALEVRRNVCLGQQTNGGSNCRLSVTLVMMFTAHVLLVSPSDVIKYFEFYSIEQQFGDIIACILNLTQTCNFALNFLLYLSLNSSFRETIRSTMLRVFFCERRRFYCERRRQQRSISFSGRMFEMTQVRRSASTPRLNSCHTIRPNHLADVNSRLLVVSMCDLRLMRQNDLVDSYETVLD